MTTTRHSTDNDLVDSLIDIRLLGRFAVVRPDGEVARSAFGGRQAAKLLRVLATRRGEFVSRDVLVDVIWPEQLPAEPAPALNVLIHRIRRALGRASLVASGPGGYSLIETGSCRLDTDVFLSHTEAGLDRLAGGQVRAGLASFRVAFDSWTGEPLAEDAYDDWAQPFRTRLERTHLEALEGAARAGLALGHLDEAAGWAEQAIAGDPLRETPYLLLGQAFHQAGNPAAAIEVLERLRSRLNSELTVEPSAEVARFRAQLMAGGASTVAHPVGVSPTCGGSGTGDDDLAVAREVLAQVIRRQGPGSERAIAIAKIAALARDDDDGPVGRLVELALIEAGGDVFAQANALATGAMLDARHGRLAESESRWEQVGRMFASVGADTLLADIRGMAMGDVADMLEHLAQLFGLWCEAVGGDSSPALAEAGVDRDPVPSIADLETPRRVASLGARRLVREAAELLADDDLEAAGPYLASALFQTRVLGAEVALACGAPDADSLVAEALASAPRTPIPLGPLEASALTVLE